MRSWPWTSSAATAVNLAIPGCLLLVTSAGIALAQSEGTLLGRVSDPSGRAVPNATVTLHNPATLVERSVTTNGEGLFELDALSIGSYQLQVRAPGFRLYTVQAIAVEVARTIDLDVRLEIGDLSEEVTVR